MELYEQARRRGRSGPNHGHDHLVHVVGGLIGVGGLAFSMTVVHLPATHRDDIAPWWVVSAVVLVGGLVVLAALGPLARVPAAAVRRVAGAWALAFLVVTASVPVLMPVGSVDPGDQTTWLTGFVGAALTAAALAWRPSVAVGYLLLTCTLLGVARWWDTGRDHELVAAQDGVYAATAGLILVAVVWIMLRTARVVDAAAAADAAQAAAEARTASRAAERERLAAVVHDGVLAALLAGSAGTVPPDAVALEARRALDDLDELRQPAAATGEITAEELVLRLHVRAAVVGAGAELQADVRPAEVPEAVAVKLVAAAAEALRNSVRHAGAGARRTVTVSVRPGWAEIRVHDDGAGFDPGAVPAARLGVRGSILGRMSRLPGGYAEVRSAPGAGTEVVLGWRA
ncbi:histidine kinase-like protein [Georgenia soli]|uniref:Histidine kinase-like protein n=1 Tax=Georgenia soli TaxID=638953 RepID=A0A2A9EP70_9MICO|nr:ATP-binding protein [Georgenia soli]PFG40062.1 histidine kinase-like protein [Georgenia soli]